MAEAQGRSQWPLAMAARNGRSGLPWSRGALQLASPAFLGLAVVFKSFVRNYCSEVLSLFGCSLHHFALCHFASCMATHRFTCSRLPVRVIFSLPVQGISHKSQKCFIEVVNREILVCRIRFLFYSHHLQPPRAMPQRATMWTWKATLPRCRRLGAIAGWWTALSPGDREGV